MPQRIVVLSHDSLFASGIASWLKEHPDLFDVETMDSRLADTPDRLRAASPAVIILDAAEASVAERLPIGRLLEILPTAKVVRLDYESDQAWIVSGERRRAQRIEELISVLEGAAAGQDSGGTSRSAMNP